MSAKALSALPCREFTKRPLRLANNGLDGRMPAEDAPLLDLDELRARPYDLRADPANFLAKPIRVLPIDTRSNLGDSHISL